MSTRPMCPQMCVEKARKTHDSVFCLFRQEQRIAHSECAQLAEAEDTKV